MKANLQKIIEQLELCKFTCDGGSLENNAAFIELKRIASDRHDIAACLVNKWIKQGMTKSWLYITQDDIDGELGNGEVEVTIRWSKDNDTLPE